MQVGVTVNMTDISSAISTRELFLATVHLIKLVVKSKYHALVLNK